MNALEIYILFVLPAVICAAAGIGLLVLKHGARKSAKEQVRVTYDFSNVTRLRASNE